MSLCRSSMRPGRMSASLRQRSAARRAGPGFFYLAGHGIDPELIAGVFGGAQRFFALPVEVKERQSITRSLHNRGYVAMKGESLDPGKAADLKEAYNIGLDLAADDPRVLRGEPFRGVNLWPELSGWRETMLAYFDAVWALGRRLHRGIALDLGAERDFFEDKFDQPMAVLRLLHYPPQPPDHSSPAIGAGEHTDYGSLTLLLTDEVGGLEVKRRDTSGEGGWIAAPHVPGAFICNVGDCLMRWTNDVYVSTPAPRGQSRRARALFRRLLPRSQPGCAGRLPADVRFGGAPGALSPDRRRRLSSQPARCDL